MPNVHTIQLISLFILKQNQQWIAYQKCCPQTKFQIWYAPLIDMFGTHDAVTGTPSALLKSAQPCLSVGRLIKLNLLECFGQIQPLVIIPDLYSLMYVNYRLVWPILIMYSPCNQVHNYRSSFLRSIWLVQYLSNSPKWWKLFPATHSQQIKQ